MNDEKWFELFDNTKDKFEWFIKKYFDSNIWSNLLIQRENKNVSKIKTILYVVWYFLPDEKFNIIENPSGWSEFLTLIED